MLTFSMWGGVERGNVGYTYCRTLINNERHYSANGGTEHNYKVMKLQKTSSMIREFHYTCLLLLQCGRFPCN